MIKHVLVSIGLVILGSASATAIEDPATPLPWNAPAIKEDCPVNSGAVWADYGDGEDCIRYFTSKDIAGAPVAVIVFTGDREPWVRRDPEDIPRNTIHEQKAYVERLAGRIGLPVMLVARPGTFGSSGNHFERRQESEFLALNEALDEIRERHNIQRLVLLGHSGGATAGAALLTLGRTDVSCAVLTSGAFSLLERARILSEQNGRKVRPGLDTTGLPSPYDPLDHVDGVVHDPERTIIMVGNVMDSVTPFALQKKFSEALRLQGHRVRLINHPAHPPSYHNLKGSIGLEMAARCARGES